MLVREEWTERVSVSRNNRERDRYVRETHNKCENEILMRGKK